MGSRETGDTKVKSHCVGPALVLQWTLPWPYNTPDMVLYILAIFLHSMEQKWDQGTLGTQRPTVIDMVLYILAIFLHFTKQKWDQVECNNIANI